MIRLAEEKDIYRIAEIFTFGKRIAYRHIFKDDQGSFNELQVGKLIKKYENNPELLSQMYVYDDGIVKGFINGNDFAEEEIELAEFYVEPFFQGMGIGSNLLAYFEEMAIKKQKKSIFLWVVKENNPARIFYERNGFMFDGEEKYFEDSFVKLMCYRKELIYKEMKD